MFTKKLFWVLVFMNLVSVDAKERSFVLISAKMTTLMKEIRIAQVSS